MVGISKIPIKHGSVDDYQSPKEAIDVLLPYLNKQGVILEPAQGKGNLVKAFEDKGFEVIGRDKKEGYDFLKTIPEDLCEIDYVITNPPYSIKEKFLEKCYELKTPFALLMPLTTLESEKRQKLFRKYGIQLIIPNKRYNFETPSGKGQGSWFCTAWFTYGLNLPKDLNFVTI